MQLDIFNIDDFVKANKCPQVTNPIFFNFDGVPSVDSVMLALSCMGNVGVSFGLEYSFAQLPDMSKAVCSITMLVGRLEIFTYLAMLQASFWRENNW